LTLSPPDDWDPIVRGARGRRVNFVEPEKSLLLLKATCGVGHGGGKRFAIGSPEYRVIRDWIALGAPYDPAEDPRLEKLTVLPARTILPKVGAKQSLKVLVRFSDGSVRNVTGQANFEVNDEAVAKVDPSSVVTGKPEDLSATIYQCLGIDPTQSISSPEGVRVTLSRGGRPIEQALG
jgi:hypothetical protein